MRFTLNFTISQSYGRQNSEHVLNPITRPNWGCYWHQTGTSKSGISVFLWKVVIWVLILKLAPSIKCTPIVERASVWKLACVNKILFDEVPHFLTNFWPKTTFGGLWNLLRDLFDLYLQLDITKNHHYTRHQEDYWNCDLIDSLRPRVLDYAAFGQVSGFDKILANYYIIMAS